MLAPTTDAATAEAGGLTSVLAMLIPLALMILVFYFLLIRPESKRKKQMNLMLSNLQIADEVVTSGGIVGRVLRVQDDTVLIETGGDKTRLRVLKSAIIENRTVHDVPAAIDTKKK
jgi:preprotein translocase subunit YajC